LTDPPPFFAETPIMPADFADASLVALAERQNLSRVASFDRDCAVYRALGKRAFTNVFFGD
jgi:hypothetical protein